METMILMVYTFMLFGCSMMLRDLSGRRDRKARKGRIFYISIMIVGAVIIYATVSWVHWWHAVAWIVGFLLVGWLGHYMVT